MSRKWERMVEKNSKQLNQARQKQGKKPFYAGQADEPVMIRGRSWLLPVLLFGVGIFCLISFRSLNQDDMMYWVTSGCYILLALFTFLVRRPYLKVGKKTLSTRRFSGERSLEAGDLTSITLMKDAFIIEGNNKTRWTFSKIYHWMDMGQASAVLREFAKHNAVELKDEA